MLIYLIISTQFVTGTTLGNKILIALCLGLIIGFTTKFTLPIIELTGQGFIMLLQMTALPYISVSLIYGIGSMSRKQSKKLLYHGSIAFVILSLFTLLIIFLSPIAFPNWDAAAFYSAADMLVQPKTNILESFIPSNPFKAYAEAIVPAVVIFSIFLGVGFIGVENKRRSLYVFKDLRHALSLVTNSVMKLGPLGIFAIAMHASATLNPDELDGLIVYITTVASIVFLLTFVILPLLVAIFTPLTYRQTLSTAKEASITAFATGSLFVVLPIIVESVRDQLKDYAKMYNDARRIPSIMVPISYSLPIGGKLVALLFVLFAGWFSGENVSVLEYPELMILGVFQLFGSTMIAIPNLLDSFDISQNMFSLYIVSEQLIVSRLAALLSVMYMTVLSLLITLMLMGKVQFHLKPFFSFIISVPICTMLIFGLLSFGFDSISHQYQGYSKFIDRELLLTPAKARYLKEPSAIAQFNFKSDDILENIQSRGFIRMGYYRDSLPYVFNNKDGKLVGLDVEIAHLLANELDVEIEFVRIFRNQTDKLLNNGYLDLVAGIPITPESLISFTLTQSYVKEPLALLVRDEDRKSYTNWVDILKAEDLVIGIPEAFFYAKAIRENLPNNTVWEMSTPRIMFKEKGEDIDAMIYGAAAASAWTLLYPDYSVIIPKPHLSPLSMGFPIPSGDHRYEHFLSNWIKLKQNSKTIDAFYQYWIEGENPGYFVK